MDQATNCGPRRPAVAEPDCAGDCRASVEAASRAGSNKDIENCFIAASKTQSHSDPHAELSRVMSVDLPIGGSGACRVERNNPTDYLFKTAQTQKCPADPNCTVLTINLAKLGSAPLDGCEIGSLHNKHGYASREHCHCCDRDDDPSQAGARVALHQFVIRSDDQDGD
jgi:hypothetical protein